MKLISFVIYGMTSFVTLRVRVWIETVKMQEVKH